MHINVSDILAQEEGYRTSFDIVDEDLELDDPRMAESLSGRLMLIRVQDGLALDGKLSTAVVLQCHRCLRDFAFPLELRLRGDFSRQPTEDQWALSQDFVIDVDALVHQEIILGIPIKQLCQPDCPGLDPETGKLKSVISNKRTK